MGAVSQVTDAQLQEIRDRLQKAINKTPRAWQIAEEVTNIHKCKLDDSTIRGRFIEMGQPLRGGSSGVAGLPEVAPPKIVVKEEQTEKKVINVSSFQIPDDLKSYIPPSEHFDAYVERPIDINLGIHYDIGPACKRYKYPITQGKQGTGKTFSHAFYAWKRQLPFFLFSCYEDFKLAKMFGDKTIINGSVMFQESMFVKAIQGPCVILFDEVNAITNANSFDFHALLQNRELFIKDADNGNGKTYRLNPECRIGFAQNPKSAKYIGGNIKPSNFLGRCTFLTYPEFKQEEIEKAMQKKFPNILRKDLLKFVQYYFGAVKCIDQAGLPLDISIRQLTNIIDLWVHGMGLEDALKDGMIGMLDAVSQPTAKEAFLKLAQGCWTELLPENMQKGKV